MFVIPGWCWANSNAIDKPLTRSLFRNILIVVIFDRRVYVLIKCNVFEFVWHSANLIFSAFQANLLRKIQNHMWSQEIQNIRFLDIWSRNMFGVLQNTSRTEPNDKLYNLEGLKTCLSVPWYEKCFHNWFSICTRSMDWPNIHSLCKCAHLMASTINYLGPHISLLPHTHYPWLDLFHHIWLHAFARVWFSQLMPGFIFDI